MSEETPEEPGTAVDDSVRLSALVRDDTVYFLLAFQKDRNSPKATLMEILAFEYTVYPESMGCQCTTFTGAIMFVKEYFAFSVQRINPGDARIFLDNQQNALMNQEGQWPITRL